MKLKMKKNPNSNKKTKETNQPRYENYYEYFDTNAQERVRLVWKNNINSYVVPSSKMRSQIISLTSKFLKSSFL